MFFAGIAEGLFTVASTNCRADGRIAWITGLSGSGKTTLARALKKQWPSARACVVLDGDELRKIMGDSFGYSKEDRIELGLSYLRLARALSSQGVDVIVATISMNAQIFSAVQDIPSASLIYIATPVSECARRDPKHLYRNLYEGHTSGLAGVDVPIDIPQNADVVISPSRAVGVTEAVRSDVNRILAVLSL